MNVLYLFSTRDTGNLTEKNSDPIPNGKLISQGNIYVSGKT